MNNYHFIEFNTDYNMKELSAKKSCENMSFLSKSDFDYQNKKFINIFQMGNCYSQQNYENDLYNIKTNESGLLKGININKKSCIYKRPAYNEGDWTKQYDISNMNKNTIDDRFLFDYQSKAKTNSEYKNCGNLVDFSLLGECNKPPFFTYTRTFTNNFDNCV
jgi:hypothetical protein